MALATANTISANIPPVIPKRHPLLVPGLAILVFLMVGFSIAFVVQRKRDIAFQKFYEEKKAEQYQEIVQQLARSGKPVTQEEIDKAFAALSSAPQNISDVDISTIFQTIKQGEMSERKEVRKEFRSSRSL